MRVRVRRVVRRMHTVDSLALCAFLVLLGLAESRAQDCGSLLTPSDADYTYFRGTEEPSPDDLDQPTLDWADLEFDDGEWDTGVGGFWYGDNRTGLGNTSLDGMQNTHWSVYFRTIFEVDDVDSISVLSLNIDYDDGFVAYLNGVEIARRGVNGEPPAFSVAASGHESTGTLELIAIPDVSMLEEENVLAVQVHNTALGSSDCVFICELIANPDTCPLGLLCRQDPGAGSVSLSWTNQLPFYDQIQILRKTGEGEFEVLEDDIGGDQITYVDTDLPAGLVTYGVKAFDSDSPCEECPPLECTISNEPCDPLIPIGDEWTFLRGVDPGPADDWMTDEFDDGDWEVGPTGIGYGDGDDATILDDMQNSYGVVYTRKYIEIDDVDSVREIRLAIVIDDGFVVYMNGEEVSRYNMPAGPITNATFASGANPGGDPSTNPPPIEVTIPGELLLDDENLLAISVHNTGLGSSDLTFLPTACAVLTDEPPDPTPETLLLRGDADNDGVVVLTDAVYILAHLVQGGPAPACFDAADTDDDGQLVLTDAIRLLNALFQGQVPLPAPGLGKCGQDPTEDALPDCPEETAGCPVPGEA